MVLSTEMVHQAGKTDEEEKRLRFRSLRFIFHTKIRAVAGKSRDLSLGISGLLGSNQAVLSYPGW